MADDIEAKANQITNKLQTQITAIQAIGSAVQSAYQIMQESAYPEMQEMYNSWGGENAQLYMDKLSNNLSSLLADYNELNTKASEAYKKAINNARTELSAIGINPDDAGLYYNGG